MSNALRPRRVSRLVRVASIGAVTGMAVTALAAAVLTGVGIAAFTAARRRDDTLGE